MAAGPGPGAGGGSKPVSAVCHICGREFGTASIAIHMPQCEKKWEQAEALKPEKERRPVPQRPTLDPSLSPEEVNDALRKHWNDVSLARCPNCDRTFQPDRLEVHLRSCKPAPGAPPRSSAADAKKSSAGSAKVAAGGADPPAKPRSAVCHICGREFGTASIEIHLPQCAKKWEAAEALKPAKDRRPVPKRPELQEGLSAAETNDALMKHWKSEVLEACPNCSRTFLPDRLEVHMRSCKGSGGAGAGPGAATARERPRSLGASTAPSARPGSAGGGAGGGGAGGGAKAAEASSARPRSVACHICGREFGTASIDIHIPQCEKKWAAEQAVKPPGERRPVPQRPEFGPGLSQQEVNDKIVQNWNDNVLSPCPHCGRTFLPDRLEIHLRSCKPKGGEAGAGGGAGARGGGGGGASSAPSPAKGQGPARSHEENRSSGSSASPSKPRSVVCHICGREFGSASISIHIPQCEQKWEAVEAQKPASERRPVPQRPEIAAGTSREEANELLTQQWKDKALLACELCGRTFLPDRLEVHQRSCRADSPAKPRAKSTAASSRSSEGGAGETASRSFPSKAMLARAGSQAVNP